MKINEVQIKGFKAIGDLSIQPKSINVLIGRNNTGKTSFLEAIFYTINESVLELRSRYTSRLSSLINVKKPESNIVIKSDGEDRSLRLYRPEPIEIREEIKKDINRIIENSKRFFSEDQSKNESDSGLAERSREVINGISEDIKLVHSLRESSIKLESRGKTKILIEYNQQLLKHMRPLFEALDGIWHFEEDQDLTFIPFLISHKHDKPSVQPIIEFIEGLLPPFFFRRSKRNVSKSKINQIQEYLKDNISKNLIRFDFDRLLFKSENGEEDEIPYASMGSGFQAIVEFISRIKKEHRIILIEEPENHMHPRYIEELLIKLVDFARKEDMQFFITTHSCDVLEFLACNDLKSEYRDYIDKELNIIRMEKNKESIVASQFDRKDARDVIEEINSDLRGV